MTPRKAADRRAPVDEQPVALAVAEAAGTLPEQDRRAPDEPAPSAPVPAPPAGPTAYPIP